MSLCFFLVPPPPPLLFVLTFSEFFKDSQFEEIFIVRTQNGPIHLNTLMDFCSSESLQQR